MFVIVAVCGILLMVYLILQMRRPPNFPPGPVWYPFVGNLPEVKKLSKILGGQHHALEALAKKYNTNVLGLKLGNEYVVMVFSYPTIRHALTNEDYEGRPNNFFLKLRCLGKKNGITCTEGEVWNNQRSFVNRHLRNLGFGKKPMEQMVQDEISEVLSILHANGSEVSINKLLAPSVLNILWTLVAGERIPRTNKLLKDVLDLFEARAKAFDMTGGTLAKYPWLRHVLPEWSGYNIIKKVNSNLKDLFLKTIYEHEQTWEEEKNDDLIYRYLSAMKTESNIYTEEQLIMVCLDLFIAGAQTTSRTLEFAFILMVMYPDVQKKVQEHLDRYFDKNSNIEYAQRHKVPYVEAVLCEILRFRHVVPINGPRRVVKDTVLEGYTIPKNTTVLMSLYTLHNSSEYWENPEIFMPERFLNENGLLVSNEKLIPFGLGRRRCLGESLSKTFIFTMFTEILRKYTISLAPGSQPLTGKCFSGITLSPEQFTAKFVQRR